MDLVAHPNRPKLRRRASLAVCFAAAALVSACSGGGASPSPTTVTATSPSATAPAIRQPNPTPSPFAGSFTTPGASANWTDFSWSQLPAGSPLATADPGAQLVTWRGGYVACGTTNGAGFVWTSTDGQMWTPVRAIAGERVLVAAFPTGLVAIVGVAAETVWTSSDGVAWHDAGPPIGLESVDSIAGTSAGLVATGHSVSGTGKSATSSYSVAFSTDGLNWTPVTVQAGITWDEVGPRVQSGNGRFFVMGGYTDNLANVAPHRLAALDATSVVGGRSLIGSGASGKGGLWWSDDGRTWTSTGDWVYATKIAFGRDGLLAYSSPREIPGYVSLSLSTDGGKTWQSDKGFEPLGATVCGQGECTDGPDGIIDSNGTVFVAVKTNGKAWASYDARTWKPVTWGSAYPIYSILVLPRGVVAGNTYGAAR